MGLPTESIDDLPTRETSEALGPEETFHTARLHFQAQRYREAIRLLNKLLSDETFGVRAHSSIASCLLMLNQISAATRFIDRALQQDPTYIPALLNRVNVLQVQQNHEGVQSLCQQILEQNPKEEEAWKQWVRSLIINHQSEQALLLVKRWQTHLPQSFQAQMTEGELLYQQGAFKEAIQPFGEALRINNESDQAYAHLSAVMMMLRRHDAALEYINKALSIQADSVKNCCRKAQILWLMARWEEAADWFGKASLKCPESATLFLNQHLCLPSIPQSPQEIAKARLHFSEGLSRAESNPSLELDILDEAIPHTFELAYHNQDDRELLERYISLMRTLAQPILSQCLKEDSVSRAIMKDPARDRWRIGFLSQFFSKHSNAIAFEGLIRFLDRQNFEVILIHAAQPDKSRGRDTLDDFADQVVHLSSNYAASASTLRGLDLDILFFTDIGMNAYSYLLPFFKTAPVQMTGWGVPHTSGIHEIDFYISSADLEPVGSEDSYTESLVRLPGGLPCYFSIKELSFTPLPREYFMLPTDYTLLGCLQSLHKIHPDFDAVLELIAQKNPDVAFVFVDDPIEARTGAFLARLTKTAPTVRDRCMTLAHMSRAEYHALCNCIDLLLDPIYYGSGITFFEASFVGTPILTLEGHNLRSRVVSCGYREMDIEDPPIAETVDGYVELATQLINSPERRVRMRESIRSNSHRIFERLDFVRNFEDFCLQVVRART